MNFSVLFFCNQKHFVNYLKLDLISIIFGLNKMGLLSEKCLTVIL
ncbi:hypothetical protein CLU83_2249 [Flavobacterium sp. 1]|nr:hypothetical protein CLU83_2249 [Flavobacterium sp. 1]